MSGGQKYHMHIGSNQSSRISTPGGGGMTSLMSQPGQTYSSVVKRGRQSLPNPPPNYLNKSYDMVAAAPGKMGHKTSPKGKHSTSAGPSSQAGGSSGTSPSKGRRKVVKVNKGLRHFSMKVCEKVKEKGKTTYNEVADELVEDEMRRVEQSGDRSFDQKNIRRRVYDALNVLMAMNIIEKNKKEIQWLGLPTNTPAQCATLDDEIATKRAAIQKKEKELRDLLLLQVSLKNLVNRNRESEELGYIPTPNSHIQLPFIVVNTHRDTRIHCTISQDKTEYFFKFDDKFELNDHVTVLQRMGLLMGLDKGTSTDEDIHKMKQLVPPEFQDLIEDLGRGRSLVDLNAPVDMPEDEDQLADDVDEDLDDQEDVEPDEVIEYVDHVMPASTASTTVVPVHQQRYNSNHTHHYTQPQQQQQHHPQHQQQQHVYYQQPVHQQHQQQQHHQQQYVVHEEIEEYSEEDTIIEEGY